MSEKNTDAARLDWLQARIDACAGGVEFGMTEDGDVGVWICGVPRSLGRAHSLSVREAIDAAMSTSPKDSPNE